MSFFFAFVNSLFFFPLLAPFLFPLYTFLFIILFSLFCLFLSFFPLSPFPPSICIFPLASLSLFRSLLFAFPSFYSPSFPSSIYVPCLKYHKHQPKESLES